MGHLTRSPPHQPCPHTAPLSGPGLVAVFDYHRKKGYADLYSLHSWCGILAFVLYFVQVGGSEPRRWGGGGGARGHDGAACATEGPAFPGVCLRVEEVL